MRSFAYQYCRHKYIKKNCCASHKVYCLRGRRGRRARQRLLQQVPSSEVATRSRRYWSDSSGHATYWPAVVGTEVIPVVSHNLYFSRSQTQPLSTIPGVTQPLLLLRNWPMQPFEKRKKNQSAFSENHHKTISFIFYKVWCDSRCLWYYIHILPQLIDDCTRVPNLGLCTWVWVSSLLSSMIWTWFECWYIISFFIVFSIIFWLMFWVYL